MNLIKMKIGDIVPYKNNPRKNDQAVEAVMESIQQCGYVAPIIVDEENVVLAGHTRLKALKKLGYESADVVKVEGLSAAQKKKYRLLDNKTSEFSEWDFDKLMDELEGLDFEDFDFGFDSLDFMGADDDESGPDAVEGYEEEYTGEYNEEDVEQEAPPSEFKEYGDDIPTSHKCPKCGYEW